MKMREVLDKAVEDICGLGRINIDPQGEWALLLFKRLLELAEELQGLALDVKLIDQLPTEWPEHHPRRKPPCPECGRPMNYVYPEPATDIPAIKAEWWCEICGHSEWASNDDNENGVH